MPLSDDSPGRLDRRGGVRSLELHLSSSRWTLKMMKMTRLQSMEWRARWGLRLGEERSVYLSVC